MDLYTYERDLVLDPFMGSGTTAVAAVRTGRHYVGFDTDKGYLDVAEHRISEERERRSRGTGTPRWEATGTVQSHLFEDPGEDEGSAPTGSRAPNNGADPSVGGDFQARSVLEGRKAQEKAEQVLIESGFRDIKPKFAVGWGVEVNFSAIDRADGIWLFDVSGAFSVTQRPGLRRTDTLWKAIGRAAVLNTAGCEHRLVLLTTDRPAPNSAGLRALEAVTGPGKPVYAVIEMEDPAGPGSPGAAGSR